MGIILKRLLFFWTASFVLATAVYFFLWAIMPLNLVFGVLYRMHPYHWDHPLVFIAVPCFFFGIIATLLADRFSKQNEFGKILLTILTIALTVFLSSPLGGMLWHYYDMQAGFFPSNWMSKMVKAGFLQGLEIGWIIVGLSIPYNIIGAVCCYFLMKKGSKLFITKS